MTDFTNNPTIFLLSDSTVQSYEEYYFPQTGWGQVFYENFKGSEHVRVSSPENCSYPQGQVYRLPGLTIENRAIGGRSSRSFIEEGKLREAAAVMKPGDYVFVQFGHNDATPSRPARYVPAEQFADYLKIYAETCRKADALCVFVTPVARRNCNAPISPDNDTEESQKNCIPVQEDAASAFVNTRNSFVSDACPVPSDDNGTLADSRDAFPGENPFSISFPEYRDEMMRFAEENGLPLLDLGKKSTDYLNQIGREESKKLYLHAAPGKYSGAYAGGIEDNTHLSLTGARIYCRMVADLIREAKQLAPLSDLLSPNLLQGCVSLK